MRAEALAALGLVELRRGNAAEAERLVGTAVQIARRSIELAMAVQSERQQLRAAEEMQRNLSLYLSVTHALPASAARDYEFALSSKGAVFSGSDVWCAPSRSWPTSLPSWSGSAASWARSCSRCLSRTSSRAGRGSCAT